MASVSEGWSGKRDSNPRLRPWQGRTLPLSYSRPRGIRRVPQRIQPKQGTHRGSCSIIHTVSARARGSAVPPLRTVSLRAQSDRTSLHQHEVPAMEYHDDLNLRPDSDDTPVLRPMHLEEEPPLWPKLVAIAVLLIAVASTGYLLFRNRGAATPANAPTAPAAAAPTEPPPVLGTDAAPIDLPPLNESDDVVRG